MNERRLKEVLENIIRASQANFDHLSGEAREFARLFNKLSEDVRFLYEALGIEDKTSGNDDVEPGSTINVDMPEHTHPATELPTINIPPGWPGEDGEDGLFGPPGRQGVDGAPGAPGAGGPPGFPGEDGESFIVYPGPAGPTGPQGADGVSNVPGPQGPPGSAGEDSEPFIVYPGPAGPTGPQGPAGNDGASGAPPVPPGIYVPEAEEFGMWIPPPQVSASALSGGDGAYINDAVNGLKSFHWEECFYKGTAGDSYAPGCNAFATGTGSVTADGTAATTSAHPGVIRATSGSAAGARAGVVAANNLASIVLGGGKIRFGILAKLVTLSDATNRYITRMGMSDNSTNGLDPNDGILFYYSDNVNSGEWQGQAWAGGVSTLLDTNIAADTGWHLFEYVVNAAGGSVEFFIDRVSVGSISSGLPTAATAPYPFFMVRSAGAARSLDVDFYYYHFFFEPADRI